MTVDTQAMVMIGDIRLYALINILKNMTNLVIICSGYLSSVLEEYFASFSNVKVIYAEYNTEAEYLSVNIFG